METDALVAVWLGLDVEDFLTIARARYSVLTEREASMRFDSNGRRIAADSNAFGFGQTKDTYSEVMAYLEDPISHQPPEGYTPPFYKADREWEYREAHAVFSKRLKDAIDAGWTPS
ncbi:hypothetical protein ACFQX7_27635 [Luedemannella flava]